MRKCLGSVREVSRRLHRVQVSKPTKVSNKYDLLETNVKAEIDEDEDEKTGKESSVHALPHRRHTLPRAFA